MYEIGNYAAGLFAQKMVASPLKSWIFVVVVTFAVLFVYAFSMISFGVVDCLPMMN